MPQVFDISLLQAQHRLAKHTRATALSARVARVAQHFSCNFKSPIENAFAYYLGK